MNGPFPEVDLVDADDQAIRCMEDCINALVAVAAGGEPGVVSIQEPSVTGFVSAVETGPFDVRIILTEEPKDSHADHIQVVNGSAASTAGLPIEGSPGAT